MVTDYIKGEPMNMPFSAPYLLSDFLLVFMFLRMTILVRNFFNYSRYSDVFAKRLCDRYGFTANTRFCFKCYIIKRPLSTVLLTLVTAIIVLAYLMWILERPFHRALEDYTFEPYVNCLYQVIITMTTCGYGDYVPWTPLGKVVSMVNVLFGGFIVTLTIVTLGGIFNFNIE